MKFNLLIKKLLVCILSCIMFFAAFTPAVFACSENNETLLCIAARSGNLEEVWRLVDGVDVNCSRGANGETPLHFAVIGRHLEIVKFLVTEVHADINCRDRRGRTPLHLAASLACLEVVRYLVEEGHADVNCRDYEGQTPLHVAASEGNLEVVRWLVEEGDADVTAQDENGQTPLDLAEQNGQLAVVEVLRSYRQKLIMALRARLTPRTGLTPCKNCGELCPGRCDACDGTNDGDWGD